MAQVIITPKAEKQYNRLSPTEQTKIKKKSSNDKYVSKNTLRSISWIADNNLMKKGDFVVVNRNLSGPDLDLNRDDVLVYQGKTARVLVPNPLGNFTKII